MRLSLRLLSLGSLFFCSAGCREDFSLEADFRDVPVVFSYLDAAEPEHFVRVERAVPGGDAGAGAAEAEQLYYGPEAATVSLTNLATLQSAELERVDGNELAIPRQSGPFAGTPNVLYRLAAGSLRLDPGQEVEVRVSRPGEADATATTTLLRPLNVLRPSTIVRLDDYRRPLVVSWTAGELTAVFAVQLLFRVQEFYTPDPGRDRTVDLVYTADAAFVPEAGDRNGDQVQFEVDNEAVYRFLGEALPADGDVTRRLTTLDVRVTGVGEEVARLLTLRNANAGLTGSQPPPDFTNVMGGQGLVTGRTVGERSGAQLDEGSLDSLREGRYTRGLNFR